MTAHQGSSLPSINISQLATGHYFLKAISLNNPPLEGRETQEQVMKFEKL